MISLLVFLVASTVAPAIGAPEPDEEGSGDSTELKNIEEVLETITGDVKTDTPNLPDWARPIIIALEKASNSTGIRIKRNAQQPGRKHFYTNKPIHPLLKRFDPNTFNMIQEINATGNTRLLLDQLYVGLVYMYNPGSIPGYKEESEAESSTTPPIHTPVFYAQSDSFHDRSSTRIERNPQDPDEEIPQSNNPIHPFLQRFDPNTFTMIKEIHATGNTRRLLKELYVGLVYMFNPESIPGYSRENQAKGSTTPRPESVAFYVLNGPPEDRNALSHARRASSHARSASSKPRRASSHARNASSHARSSSSHARSASSHARRASSHARRATSHARTNRHRFVRKTDDPSPTNSSYGTVIHQSGTTKRYPTGAGSTLINVGRIA